MTSEIRTIRNQREKYLEQTLTKTKVISRFSNKKILKTKWRRDISTIRYIDKTCRLHFQKTIPGHQTRTNQYFLICERSNISKWDFYNFELSFYLWIISRKLPLKILLKQIQTSHISFWYIRIQYPKMTCLRIFLAFKNVRCVLNLLIMIIQLVFPKSNMDNLWKAPIKTIYLSKGYKLTKFISNSINLKLSKVFTGSLKAQLCQGIKLKK